MRQSEEVSGRTSKEKANGLGLFGQLVVDCRPMPLNLVTELDKQIGEMERQLAALRSARSILARREPATPTPTPVRRRRRRFTAAQRADISRRMKAAWAKRKAASK
jgi:hypothetical protein